MREGNVTVFRGMSRNFFTMARGNVCQDLVQRKALVISLKLDSTNTGYVPQSLPIVFCLF